jgi:UDP:flavonoid glycosyltransferase YjiC (YdhE family)
VLAAVRDIPAASSVLGPADIPFVQAPFHTQGIRLPHRLAGYADILLTQGWADRSALWGLVHSWLNLFELFEPHMVVLNYSPIARLAARIAGIPAVLVGNGFELPPATQPLPPFPGFSWATSARAAESEQQALDNANHVLHAFGASCMESLSELFVAEKTFLTTFPELDHYGPRINADYVGTTLGFLPAERIDWPSEHLGKSEQKNMRIFAYVRPDTPNVASILDSLAKSSTTNSASVICFAPGFSAQNLEKVKTPLLRFVSQPVDLPALVSGANVCVAYGEGTAATFLLAGVPLLLVPGHMEALMAARRVEALGAGLVLQGEQTSKDISELLDEVARNPHYQKHAQFFADKHRGFDVNRAANEVVDQLETVLNRTTGTGISMTNKTAPLLFGAMNRVSPISNLSSRDSA